MFARRFPPVPAALGAALLFALAGCFPADSARGGKAKGGHGHAHAHPDEGPHHGALAEWGEEEYHPEFTVDHKTQEATVYILDGNAKKAKPIKAKSIGLALKLQPPVTLTLDAKPQQGDPEGASSRFVGKHAALAKEQEFEGTISGEVDGKPYSGDFKEKAGGHGHKH